MHHNRWLKQREAMSDAKRDQYDETLISRGLLMPSKQGRPPVADDVFADVAAEIISGVPAESEQLAERITDEATEEVAAEPRPKKGRAPKRKKT